MPVPLQVLQLRVALLRPGVPQHHGHLSPVCRSHHRLRYLHQHLHLPLLHRPHLPFLRQRMQSLLGLHRQLLELHRQCHLHRLPRLLWPLELLLLLAMLEFTHGVPAVFLSFCLYPMLQRLLPLGIYLPQMQHRGRQLRSVSQCHHLHSLFLGLLPQFGQLDMRL